MEDFYDSDDNEETGNETPKYFNKEINIENDISVKWKEATTQMDYGIDVNTSSILLFGEIMDGSLYDVTIRIRAILHMRDESKKNDPINSIINSDGGSV